MGRFETGTRDEVPPRNSDCFGRTRVLSAWRAEAGIPNSRPSGCVNETWRFRHLGRERSGSSNPEPVGFPVSKHVIRPGATPRSASDKHLARRSPRHAQARQNYEGRKMHTKKQARVLLDVGTFVFERIAPWPTNALRAGETPDRAHPNKGLKHIATNTSTKSALF